MVDVFAVLTTMMALWVCTCAKPQQIRYFIFLFVFGGFFVCLFVLGFFVCVLGLHPWYIEVSRLGVK